MLDRGIHDAFAAIGFNTKVILWCENDPDQQAILDARMRDGLIDRARSGRTSRPSTVVTSEAQLTLWLEVFHARIYRSQATGLALAKALEAAYSSTSSASQPIAERLSSCWRTSGALFPLPPMFRRPRTKKGSARNAPSPWSSEPWPMPGITRHGCLYAHPMPGLPTVDSDGSAWDGEAADWPTPNSADSKRESAHKRGNPSLPMATKAWPTPTMADGNSAGNRNLPGSSAHQGTSLTDATTRRPWPTPRCEDSECAGGHRGKDDTLYGAIVRPKAPENWATPKHRDYRSGCTDQESIDHLMERRVPGSNDLTNQVTAVTEDRPTGTLNPAWVEILMGWPEGWTDTANPCPGIWPGWPAGMGPYQHDHEPPRIAPKGSVQGRVARIKACGNGVVPQQAAMAFGILLAPAAKHLEEQP